jgi:hypothetical protein
MFRVPSGRLAGPLAGVRAAAAVLAIALPLASIVLAGASFPAAQARVGVDDAAADEPSPFASPDPAGLGAGEGEPPAEGYEEVPPPAIVPQPPPPDEAMPAGPDERGPAADAPASGPPAADTPAPTPFGVDPSLGIRPPTADAPPDTSPLPAIHYGEDDLPEPVRKTRAAILEAARGGDIEALRAVLETSEMPPVLARGDIGDPITFLKESSGDPEGREILAILIDLLEAGWIKVDEGKPTEMYVWPYFVGVPIDRLTPPQLVELYRILTAADVDEMRAYDAWLFFKIGIGPDGTWHFFMVEEP